MRLSCDICHCYMERTVQNFNEEKPSAGHKQFSVASNISDMIASKNWYCCEFERFIPVWWISKLISISTKITSLEGFPQTLYRQPLLQHDQSVLLLSFMAEVTS